MSRTFSLKLLSTVAIFLTAGGSLSVVIAAQTSTKETSNAEMQTTPPTSGINHLGLSVRDLDASVAFFTDTLHWKTAGGVPDYPSVFVTDGTLFLTLWQTTTPETAIAFDRKNNVGLHHLALTVHDLETLDELHETLKKHPQVTIEFAPEFLGDGPTTHMMIREPSGVRVEFIVPKGRHRSDPK